MIRNLAWETAGQAYKAGYGWVLLTPSVPAPYTYNATVVRVIDGDTIQVDVDFGFFLHHSPTEVRLLGCNAAEHNTPGGAAAKANLEKLLPVGTRVVLSSAKPDKYAPRWDCSVTVVVNGQPMDLVAWLVAEQWAAAWDGSGTKPLPPWPRTVS